MCIEIRHLSHVGLRAFLTESAVQKYTQFHILCYKQYFEHQFEVLHLYFKHMDKSRPLFMFIFVIFTTQLQIRMVQKLTSNGKSIDAVVGFG